CAPNAEENGERAGRNTAGTGPLSVSARGPPRGCSSPGGDHSPSTGGSTSGFSSSQASTASASWPSPNSLTTLSSSEPNSSSVMVAPAIHSATSGKSDAKPS